MTDADMIKLAAASGAAKALEKAQSAEDWAGKILAISEHKALATLYAEIKELQFKQKEKPKEASP